MRRAEKVSRRSRRNKHRSSKKTKALKAAATCATAGTTLIAMAVATPAGASYTSPNGYVYYPGNALQAGASVEAVTNPVAGAQPLELDIDGASGNTSRGSTIANYTYVTSGGTYVGAYALGTVPLFADDGLAVGGVTDCAGESITTSTVTFAGCYLKTFNTLGVLADQVGVTVAFPNVTQSATLTTGLTSGLPIAVTTNAQADPRFGAMDSVVLEECGPMPAGVAFNINSCVGLGTMTGTSGNYMASVSVQDPVGSTTCAGHSGSTSQCSLWTVEVHNDSTGRYWWPLAAGLPITFK